MRACRATHVSLHLFASPLTAHSAFEATPLRMVHDRPVFLISWHGYTPFQGCRASPVMVRSRSCHVAAPGIGGTPGDATRGRPARRVQGNWNSWCPFGCPPRLDKNNRRCPPPPFLEEGSRCQQRWRSKRVASSASSNPRRSEAACNGRPVLPIAIVAMISVVGESDGYGVYSVGVAGFSDSA